MAVFSKKERLGLLLLEDVISLTVKTIKKKRITNKVRTFILMLPLFSLEFGM
jgi:hypothetical protein